ncbi:hypothetical protein HYPSUDRAFT_59115 [Hypholoma sublateritium FD-334 SS-4]|uniref:GmrSD restriction endonucleases N-terminal domain-containing protein n=1 Tax=Hypholoma sublateritium (strain FD-334 SS-4) TaxID=945553 RepID=A0A0D2N710_HYPSF|nr:hypothetical protein HYPSUDRAFT_59115 [Hypholoma sublateritium FD-334 SS-4]
MPPNLDTTWFDDDGELTELDSSDEEDDVPAPPPLPRKPIPTPAAAAQRAKMTRASTQTATATSKQRRAQKGAVPCLKPPRTTNYSAVSLFDWIQNEQVDLNPEYQRGVVWNDSKQVALIGSLFSNYYVPPIVFTVKRNDDGSEIRVCIDGKQRLTSIHRFMLGEIANKDPSTNRKSYFTNLPGTKGKLIADHLRNIFKYKQITCVEYEDLTAEQEREIFQRVQLGVCLAPADRLPAINGPHADIVRSLRQQLESTPGFKLYFNWGNVRGKDFQALAQIVYLIAHGHEAGKAEPTPARIEVFLAAPPRDSTALHTLDTSARAALDTYCRILVDAKLGEKIRTLLHPLEFVMAAYLVARHRIRLNEEQLANAMERMREAHASLVTVGKVARSATRIFKTLLAFVLNEVHVPPAKERGRPAAPKAAADAPEEPARSAPKRKRAPSEPSDNVCVPPPRKRAAPRAKVETGTQKVEAGRTPPLGGQAPKPESLLQAHMPSAARSARTVVKPAKKGDAQEKKSTGEVLQTARPSVRPQASAKTLAPVRKSSQTIAGPSRAPLPGRTPSASAMSPTPPVASLSSFTTAPCTTGTAGPEASSSSSIAPGGRLAALRTAKAVADRGAPRSASGPSACPSTSVAPPSSADACGSTSAPPVRRLSTQLPRFTKNSAQAAHDRETHPLPQKPQYQQQQQQPAAELSEAQWKAALSHISSSLAVQTAPPPSRRASLATPTVSPIVPHFVLQVPATGPPTKDPRLVKRGLQAQAATAAAANAEALATAEQDDELREKQQQHELQRRQQQQQQQRRPPNAPVPRPPSQPWHGSSAAQKDEWFA